MSKIYGLKKTERLKSRKKIDELFEKGKGFSVPPLRIIYTLEATKEFPQLQVAVSAPKRNFKKAVDRNRLKRLLREAYRLNKKKLLTVAEERKVGGTFFINYTSKKMESFEMIAAAMIKALRKLEQIINTHESNS